YRRCRHRAPPSFPTRRSSDLASASSTISPLSSDSLDSEQAANRNTPTKIAHNQIFVFNTNSPPFYIQNILTKFPLSKNRCFLIRSEEHTSELQSRFDLVCRRL